MSQEQVTDTQGMSYLDRLPRRVAVVYLPLGVFTFVLLFPFYWMATTTFKPDQELLSRDANPFWVVHPTFAHIEKLLFHTSYPEWMWNTVVVSVVSRTVCMKRRAARSCSMPTANLNRLSLITKPCPSNRWWPSNMPT